MLAHELRNPLAPIRNMLEIMKRSDDDLVIRREARETIERQLAQLVRLVDDLLDVSRITRDKIELRAEPIELSSVINQAIETSRPLVEKFAHELVVDLPADPVPLDGDPVRLAQVFSNLLHNACKFTPPRGRIVVSAEKRDGEVSIRVADDGIGIPPDVLSTIFEMFAQADSTLERAQDGLGIGLTLVKRLVELHGGSIVANSGGPGRGSEFVVRLPIGVEDMEKKYEDIEKKLVDGKEAVGAARPASSRRVLVVDDNRDSARSLAMLLKLSGNETQTAYDALEALETAAGFRPHVVLLDIGMPNMNGYDACRAMRASDWGKEATIVAVTGWGQEDFRSRSRESGFDGHLVKPVDLGALTGLLAEMERGAAVK